MRLNYETSLYHTKNEHYGVSYNNLYVLVQIQGAVGNRIEQVRIPLTVDEAEHMITLLQKAIEDHKEIYL